MKASTEGPKTSQVCPDIEINEPEVGLPGDPGCRPGVIRGQIYMVKIAAKKPKIEYTDDRLAFLTGSDTAERNEK